MESSVTSQISSQTYNAELSKLHKGDIGVQSELFEINIFNRTLHIAPGKSISGDNKLVYFYVYAIKDEKVVANLGVYELFTDEQKSIYDISTFDNLLLFDYYYTNPTKIKEFEITGKNNIFDYIKTHLEFVKGTEVLRVYNTFTSYKKEQKEYIGKHYASYNKILKILFNEIKTRGIDDEKVNELKEIATDIEIFKLTLAVLEPFLNVQFSFIHNGQTVDNLRNKTPEQTFAPKQYILVSTDQTFISTSSTLKQDEDLPEDLDEVDEAADEVLEAADEVVEELTGEAVEEGVGDELEEGEIDEDDAVPEMKGDTRVKFLGKRIPVVKSKTEEKSKTPAMAESKSDKSAKSESKLAKSESKLAKPESKLAKAESKLAKAESKSAKPETSSSFGSFFLKQSKADAKAESKASKAEPKAPKPSQAKAAAKAEPKTDPKSSKPEGKSTLGTLFGIRKPSKVKEPEKEPTNLENAGIFNKNFKAPEPEPEKKEKPKLKKFPSAPKQRYLENKPETEPSRSNP